MLAIGMDVSTESRDSFGINVVVTRFMGDPALFERKANELLGHDPLYGALEESSVTQEVLSQIQKYPCPRCHEEMKCVKKRFGVIGADYFNMKKHLINFCVGRTQEEKVVVLVCLSAWSCHSLCTMGMDARNRSCVCTCQEIVDALMKAKGQKKSPTHRPIEITLREIKSVKKLKALCLDCEKVTKVLKGILKEFSKK
mmetsp:Transcript_40136/g.78113  ORF Transcript_40136/g.78113 Transcript_40136/m.78113 type:complete len:198 (+) Transcript_40136:665-1258(+)